MDIIQSTLDLLVRTPEQLANRKAYLEKVKAGLAEWNAKPDSNFRIQSPDEQINNNDYRLIVEVETNA